MQKEEDYKEYEYSDKEDRENKEDNVRGDIQDKSKKTIEEKLFDVISNTLESFREYTKETGIPIAEEISYQHLYRFLTNNK